jgi:DNA-binding transcriptional MerR regulator
MTTTLRIAEVAERTGFSPPTLRYYETIGLLPPPQRAGNGYRVYDDRALDRLAIIARAKQLGCSLDEIAGILDAGEAGHCAPVQGRLSDLLAGKIADARARIVELTTLVADLQRTASLLAAHTPDGPCDDRCGCLDDPAAAATGPAAAAPEPVPLVAKPSPDAEPPIACTLGAGAMGQRLSDWEAVLAQATDRSPIDGGVRLAFAPDAPLARIATLAAAEQGCCAFFHFALTVDQRGIALEVRAPADAQDVLTALFGAPAATTGAPA